MENALVDMKSVVSGIYEVLTVGNYNRYDIFRRF